MLLEIIVMNCFMSESNLFSTIRPDNYNIFIKGLQMMLKSNNFDKLLVLADIKIIRFLHHLKALTGKISEWAHFLNLASSWDI